MASLTKQPGTSDAGILTQLSDCSVPLHYVMEIDCFSMLSSNNIDKFESNEFEAGGYKWKFIVYPKGDKNTVDHDYVSLHVSLLKTSVKVGEQIYAIVRFSVFDQIHDKYLTKQGGAESFHRMKSDWGISKFMPRDIFTNTSSGYLVDDKCMFGVGIFVMKSCSLGESLTLKGSSSSYTHIWDITKCSPNGRPPTYSNAFRVGDYEWRLHLYPESAGVDHRSLSLECCNLEGRAKAQKVNASCTFRAKGRCRIATELMKWSGWFHLPDTCTFSKVTAVERFKNSNLYGCCIIEVEVAVFAAVTTQG